MTQQCIDSRATFTGAIDRVEIIENRMQQLARAVGAAHFGGTIEAIELKLDAMRSIGVVLPHPLDELAIRIEPAEAVAEARLCHGVV